MKKIILSVVIFCALASWAQAQEFRFGLTASPVFDWYRVNGDKYSNDGLKLGFQYGLLFDQTIGNVERYAFATGLIINMGSGTLNTTDSSGATSISYTNRVQYIEIPLTIKLRTNEVNYMTYYGLFGLTPGVNIKARGDVQIDPDNTALSQTDINFRSDNDFNYKYNLFNISLTVGGGVEYSMSENTSIQAGLFFQNGFVNVINDDDAKIGDLKLVGNTDNNTALKQFGIRLGVLF